MLSLIHLRNKVMNTFRDKDLSLKDIVIRVLLFLNALILVRKKVLNDPSMLTRLFP